MTTTTAIYNDLGTLVFNSSCGEALASRADYETADRCVGSIFEALTPNERVTLADGEYLLDEDLDLISVPVPA